MLVSAIALALVGAPLAASAASSHPTATASAGSGFVTRQGTSLSLNGQPYRFAGFNIYQANSVSNCSYTLGTGTGLDQSLSDIGNGPNYAIRAWFFQFLGTVNGQLNWTAFDHTLAVAAAHGYKVIPTLTNQWGSCESQPNSVYKTLAWYQGGYKASDGITPLSFRNYVAQIVTRYKDNPTILSWQLVNEAEAADAQNGSCSETSAATALRSFTDDIGGLVKSIDPNHLVNLGSMGSGQCGFAGADYQYVNGSPSNDWCEYHDYGRISEVIPAKLQDVINSCKSLNRPTFVGETGIITSAAGSYAQRASDFDAKFKAQFAAGVSGELVWSWNLSGSTNSYDVGPGTPTVAVVAKYAASAPVPAPSQSPSPIATAAPSPSATTSPSPSATTSPSPSATASTSPSPSPSPSSPASWTFGDIGKAKPAGSQSFDPNSGTWTINAGGADIGFKTDAFRFVRQTLSGDGSISARVTSQSNTSNTAKAGLMFRQSTDPASPEYAVLVTPGTGIKVQVRSVQGGSTTKIADPAGTAPAYVKITRVGSTFSAYRSSDGTSWTLIAGSTYSLNLSPTLLEGLAVTSHNTGKAGTVTIDSVRTY